MGITIAGVGTPYQGTTNTITSFGVPMPTGIAVGDLMLMQIVSSVTANPTLPSGWTVFEPNLPIGSPGPTHITYSRWVESSDLTSTGVTITAPSGKYEGQIVAFRGVDSTNPKDVAAPTGTQSANATLAVPPSITTATAGALVVLFAGANSVSGVTTATWSSTNMAVAAQGTSTVSGQTNPNAAILTAPMATPGTFSPNATVAPGSGRSSMRVVALRPAATATPTPGAVLNIGPGQGQNHFSVQIAPNGASSIETHTMAEIAAGYTDPTHFWTTPDGWVRFQPRADGPTTSGTTYARDELREVDANGDNYKFDALAGVHSLTVRFRINHVPANDPDVVVMQLHNGDADRIAVRTQMFSSGTTVLGVRVNGTLHATRLQNPFVPDSVHVARILLTGGGAAEIYYNDMATPVITLPVGTLVQTSHPDGWYWKAGAYAQFNEVDTGATGLTVPATEYAQVDLKDLAVTHATQTGGTASGFWTYTGSAAGRQTTVRGAGSWGFAGTASGRPTRDLSDWSASVSATTQPPAGGAASGNWTYTGSAAGRQSTVYTAGSWGYTGSAAGRQTSVYGAGSWGFSGAAEGRASTSIASGSWGFSGAAAGRQATVYTAGSWGYTGSAVGRSTASSAIGSWGFSGVATGRATTVRAAGSWGFAGVAAGRQTIVRGSGEWRYVGTASGGGTASGTSRVKKWTGTAWVTASVKKWSGSAWVTAPTKVVP